MPTVKQPTKPGLHWASFEDEGGVVLEVVLLHVKSLGGVTDFSQGGFADFVDLSGRGFDWSPGKDLVQPSHMTPSGAGMWPRFHNQVRITWHGEARPPRTAPKVGDLMPDGRPEPAPVKAQRG